MQIRGQIIDTTQIYHTLPQTLTLVFSLLMKRVALFFWTVVSPFAACIFTRDEMSKAEANRTPVVHNTIVDCSV